MNIRHILTAAVIACGAAGSPSALAHARLEASQPAANSVLAAAPKVVRLRFNEPLELPFSKVRLLDKAGTAGAPLKLEKDKADPKTLVATLPPLKSGSHRIQWTTVTRDGHKVKGELAFQVR